MKRKVRATFRATSGLALKLTLDRHGRAFHWQDGWMAKGWACDVEAHVNGKPVAAYGLSRLEGSTTWGIDSEFGPWMDSDNLSCPVHCNGFGSLGVARRTFSDRVNAWLNAEFTKSGRGPRSFAEVAVEQFNLEF